jgi:hypothetical protein
MHQREATIPEVTSGPTEVLSLVRSWKDDE